MNSIVRVGDGDRLYGEQWNLSGVYCPHGYKPTAAGCSL